MAVVEFNVTDGVAVIVLNRPEARNAIDREMALGVANAIARVEMDSDIRVAVVTGAGNTFCAGMDLKAFLRGEAVKLPGTGLAGMTQAKLSKPFIAAVEGFALAGGFEIALACDLIVASEEAKFGLSEVKRGLVANAGGLVRLPRQLPIKIASELVLTGEMFPASRLAAHGMVNRLVPASEALSAAVEIAETIAANGPLAVSVSRRVLNESLGWPPDELFERQNEITMPVFKSADAREGAAAFAEKRAPVWRGE
jgi:enoyl-CoA hydratase